MLSLRCVVSLVVGASLWACGEESPDALVNDDISWQLGCTSDNCNPYTVHDQTASDKGFSVSCSKGSIGLNVKITDPGDSSMNRPRSILEIKSLNPSTGDCTVSVTEAATLNDSPGKVIGTCRDEDCEITGAAGNGWDFEGTIQCTNLQQGSTTSGPQYSLIKGGTDSIGGEPVVLKLDNCN